MPKRVVNQQNVEKRTQFDPLSVADRSARMAKVRSRGNRSTEMRVAACLIRNGIRGWHRHPNSVPGRPDFYFPILNLAVFVDGCFWHGCRKCNRNTPRNRREFWKIKIDTNRKRDAKVSRLLRRAGVRVLRIWEHSLKGPDWTLQLLRVIHESEPSSSGIKATSQLLID